MYNEDIKEAYINDRKENSTSEGTLNQIGVYFKICEEFEVESQKDIALFTTAEIIGVYKTFSTPSLAFLKNLNSQLVQYTDWWKNNSMLPDNQNHFREINISILEQCLNVHLLNATIVTRKELLKEIINMERYEPFERFIILALFEGIRGREFEDLRNLYPSDFKNNKVKLYSGKEYEVSSKLVELAEESAETFVYYTSDQKKRWFDPFDSRCLKRVKTECANNEKRDYERREKLFITKRLKRIKDDGYLFIGSNELKESGRIEYIKNLMAVHNLSAEECLKKFPEIQERFGHIDSVLQYCRLYQNMLNGLPVK